MHVQATVAAKTGAHEVWAALEGEPCLCELIQWAQRAVPPLLQSSARDGGGDGGDDGGDGGDGDGATHAGERQ
jgi:hypothetical protein